MTFDDHLATSVVIVNYRTKELTLEAALSALREPEVRDVVVVDNSSGDASGEFLRAALPEFVQVVDAPANLGFGRAVNLAVTRARCGLLLILNSDATLVAGTVATLAEALLAEESVGLVAPAVYDEDGHSLQDGAYGRFPTLISWPSKRGYSDGSPRAPDWVSGVAMMLRTDDFVALGGFDPSFEMYLEDVDLCRRLHDQGKLVLRVPSAGVIHLGGRSWTSSVVQRDQYHRSKIIYFRKEGLAPPKVALLQGLRTVRVLTAWFAARRAARGKPRRPGA